MEQQNSDGPPKGFAAQTMAALNQSRLNHSQRAEIKLHVCMTKIRAAAELLEEVMEMGIDDGSDERENIVECVDNAINALCGMLPDD